MVSPTSLVPEVTSKVYGDFNDGINPAEIIWGQVLSRRIEPYSYWTLELNMKDSAYVNLNLTFPWGSNWALLFRKNALPSITQHDFIKVVKNGRIEHRRHVKRDVHSQSSPSSLYQQSQSSTTALLLFTTNETLLHNSSSRRHKRDSFVDQSDILFSEYLDSGKWFLRLFNDDLLERRVQFLAQVDPTAEVRCPQQCSGNGNCVHGKCHCFDGFSADDCSASKFLYMDHVINHFYCVSSLPFCVRTYQHIIETHILAHY